MLTSEGQKTELAQQPQEIWRSNNLTSPGSRTWNPCLIAQCFTHHAVDTQQQTVAQSHNKQLNTKIDQLSTQVNRNSDTLEEVLRKGIWKKASQ